MEVDKVMKYMSKSPRRAWFSYILTNVHLEHAAAKYMDHWSSPYFPQIHSHHHSNKPYSFLSLENPLL